MYYTILYYALPARWRLGVESTPITVEPRLADVPAQGARAINAYVFVLLSVQTMSTGHTHFKCGWVKYSIIQYNILSYKYDMYEFSTICAPRQVWLVCCWSCVCLGWEGARPRQ